MRFDEEINRNICYALQKIKTNCNQNNSSGSSIFQINLLDSRNELDTFKKLEESGAIKILQSNLIGNLNVALTIHTIEPEFSELCKKIELFDDKEDTSENRALDQRLFFPKHFLKQEIDQFQSVLKHFVDSGGISQKDFQFLTITIKMVRTLIEKCTNEENTFVKPLIFPSSKINHKHYKLPAYRKYYQPTLFNQTRPIPVQITDEIIISGLKERLDALQPKSPEYSGPRFPYKIPDGTHWNNVIIKFFR